MGNETLDAPSLEVLKVRLDGILSNLSCGWCPCPWQSGWVSSLNVSFNPNLCIIGKEIYSLNTKYVLLTAPFPNFALAAAVTFPSWCFYIFFLLDNITTQSVLITPKRHFLLTYFNPNLQYHCRNLQNLRSEFAFFCWQYTTLQSGWYTRQLW